MECCKLVSILHRLFNVMEVKQRFTVQQLVCDGWSLQIQRKSGGQEHVLYKAIEHRRKAGMAEYC